MKQRPKLEILIGSDYILEALGREYDRGITQPHPLQEKLEEIVEGLTEMERELFYMRFGEQLSIRQIARRFGYASHQTFQLKIDALLRKVEEALDDTP